MKTLSMLSFFLFLFLFVGCGDDDASSGNNDVQGCDECALEPEPGMCNAAIPKYYFDQETNECTEFIWGGCGGVVPFETLEECEQCGCN